MRKMFFDALELIQSRGWDINQPIPYHLLHPYLPFLLASEEKLRWCLQHGADPNTQYKSSYRDVRTLAAGCARLPIVQLFHAYAAGFRRSNASHQCAENNRRFPVLQWFLNEVGIPINQRGLEYAAHAGCDRGKHYLAQFEEMPSTACGFYLSEGLISICQILRVALHETMLWKWNVVTPWLCLIAGNRRPVQT